MAIGGNSTLFGAIYSVLLRPLPFDRSEELYVVSSTYQGGRREFTSFTDFSDWRTRNLTFSQMGAYRGDAAAVTMPSGPEFVTAAAVSEDFFAVLQVQPFVGRTFLPVEHSTGQEQVVILSHALWLRCCGGSPAVIGTSLLVKGEPHTVVGVLPAGFGFPEGVELWRPLKLIASDANRRVDNVRVIARVRTGVGPRQAQADLTNIARELEQRHPKSNASRGIELVPLGVKSTEDVRRILLTLSGAVACILLIACANISIMLLSRGIRRAPELAVRSALGADRGRVIRQLLTESALLGALGGIGGTAVATYGMYALRAFAFGGTLRFQNAELSWPVLLFTAGLSLGTGLLVGIVPAWQLMRTDLYGTLRSGGPFSFRCARDHYLIRALAVAQVVVALVLLISAGLMVRTLERLQEVKLGFNPDRLLTFYISLPSQYRDDWQVRAFFRELLDRVRVQPGVRSASAINALYIHWGNAIVMPISIEGRPTSEQTDGLNVDVRIVDPEIHSVLQIPILRGRSFEALDSSEKALTVVVNEAMARQYFPDENPIGKRISVQLSATGDKIWHEIVGVAGDVRQKGPDADVFPEIQIPYPQSPIEQMAIVVRTQGEPVALASLVRAQVRALDPNLPLMYLQTMDDILSRSMASRRVGMRLLTVFASVALLLTAIGLYGVIATAVNDRSREIAVRLAIGGSPRRIVWTIVGQMLIVTAAGVTIGILVAFSMTKPLEPLLFGIPRADLATYATTAAMLVGVTLVSAVIPAWRAIRIDPAATLRSE